MPTVDIGDETYVAVTPEQLAPRLVDPALLGEWFPRLTFEIFMDRAEKGTRWSITGEINGSMEVWLEPMARGAVVHWFVRGEAPGRADVARRYVELLNARMFTFKDAAERAASGP